MPAKRYTVSDGRLLLTLQRDGEWFVVTSPVDPALITQAKTIEEAFVMARDAMAALALSRADTQRFSPRSRRRRASA